MADKWEPEAGDIVRCTGDPYIVIRAKFDNDAFYLIRDWEYFRSDADGPWTKDKVKKHCTLIGKMPKYYNKLLYKLK